MKHNTDGQNAELAVIRFLKKQKFKILDHNWKTTKCEIDIVAKKRKCIYFVEVKFRGTLAQGSGFEYITDNKIKQMSYAAEVWVAMHKWSGQYVLSAASVSGDDYRIEFLEEL